MAKQTLSENAESKQNYGLRKMSIGLASVLLSSTLVLSHSGQAHAATSETENDTDNSENKSDLSNQSVVETANGLVFENSSSSSQIMADDSSTGSNSASLKSNELTISNDRANDTVNQSQEQQIEKGSASQSMAVRKAGEARNPASPDGSAPKDSVSGSNGASVEVSGNTESSSKTTENTSSVENNLTGSNSPSQTGQGEQTNNLQNTELSQSNAETTTVTINIPKSSSTFKLSETLPKINVKMLSVSLMATNSKEAHIKTQEDLDRFLAQNGTDLSKTSIWFENSGAIKWPSATYTMSPAGQNSHFYFTASSTGDIDFNSSVFAIDHGGDFQWSSMQGDHKGQTIKNAYIYGSTSNGNAAAFCWFFIRASNQTVSNMHFYNAQKMASHIMDIDGANHITVENCEFAGYGVGDISDADIKTKQTQNYHNMFAEAIQIDNAKDAMNANSTTDVPGSTNEYDESATDITIHNNVFTNYRGKTGAAIVHNTDETVFDRYSATGVGQHMVSTKQLAEATGIKVYNNVFFNTIPVQNPDSTEKNSMSQSPRDMHVLFYPVHEQLTKNSTTVGNHTYYTVENNTFVNLKNGNYKTKDGTEFAINSATAFIGWAGSGGAGNKSQSLNTDTLSGKAVSWNGNTANFNTANNSYGVDQLPHDPMPSSSTTENLSHTVNRTIEYKVQGGNHQAPGALHDSLTFSGTKTTDKYTGQSSENWDGNKDFGDVSSPAIQGYTPDRQVVSNKGIGHDHSDIYEVVTYRADNQKVYVAFHDDTDNKDIKTVDLNGESDTIAYTNEGGWHAYTTENDINGYKGQGYVLVSDDTNGSQIMLDHDTGSDQHFTVHLKHGTYSKDVTDDVTRTVEYKIVSGNHQAPASATATLHFTGKQTIDSVNQNVLSSDWSANQDFQDVGTPEIQGYTPDRKNVSNKNIVHDAADIHELVTYKADNQVVHITYHDDTSGEYLKMLTLNGESDTVAYTSDGGWHAYTSASDIAGYTDNGYELVSDTTNGKQIMLDHVTNQDQNFEIHLKHTYVTITEKNPATPGTAINKNQKGVKYPSGTDKASLARNVNRTITYTMKDGSKAPDAVHDSLHFNLDKTVDKVTGKVVKAVWSDNQDFKDIASPTVKGYTPDKKSISNKDVAYSDDDIAESVAYTPDPQKAVVIYVDQTTGKTIKQQELNGVTNVKSGYTTAKAIQEYLDNGYELVSDDTKGIEIVFDNEDDKDQSYTVTLKHTYTTLTEDKPAVPGTAINKDAKGAKYPEGTDKAGLGKNVVRTIAYSASDGSQAPGPVVSVLHFTATKVVDNVTGTVVSTSWSPAQDYDDVERMEIKGYTASKKLISDKGITHDHSDITTAVVYEPDLQNAKVTYVDDTTGQIISVKALVGKSNQYSGYTTAKDISALEAKGYVLISDETNSQEVIFDIEDDVDQGYVVKLTHRIDNSHDDHTITRTIKLHKPTGTKIVKQKAYITCSVAIDAVTGKKTYGVWNQSKWGQFKVPKIKGYAASKEKLGSVAVDNATANKTVDIYYKKKKRIASKASLASATKRSKQSSDSANPKSAASQGSNSGQLVKASTGSYQAPSLPKTGNDRNVILQASGLFLTGASLLATVAEHKKNKTKF